MSKSNSKHTPKTWYRLDLSAIVYPTLQRRDFFLRVQAFRPVKRPGAAGYFAAGCRYCHKTLSHLSFRNAERIFLALSRAEYPSRSVCKNPISAISACRCRLNPTTAILYVFTGMTDGFPWKPIIASGTVPAACICSRQLLPFICGSWDTKISNGGFVF